MKKLLAIVLLAISCSSCGLFKPTYHAGFEPHARLGTPSPYSGPAPVYNHDIRFRAQTILRQLPR
jgi:hypothetical protein